MPFQKCDNPILPSSGLEENFKRNTIGYPIGPIENPMSPMENPIGPIGNL